VPASQGAHSAGEVGVPATVCSVPGWHEPAGRHADWFVVVEYVPSGHAAHARSADELAAELTNEPISQVVQTVQLELFSLALKLPPTHGVHVRSVVAVPRVPTAWPGTQLVHGTHAVAGLLS